MGSLATRPMIPPRDKVVYVTKQPEDKMKLQVGEIYRGIMEEDYGDIIRWKVIDVGRKVAVIQNQATLKEQAVTQDREALFLQEYELMPGEHGGHHG